MKLALKLFITFLVVLTLYLELCHQSEMYFSIGGEFFLHLIGINLTGFGNTNLFILLIVYGITGVGFVITEHRVLEVIFLAFFFLSVLAFFPLFDFRGQDIVF